ncbi:sigma-70 family RNA polymerase sigma factor [Helcococcus kunzii]|uniref:sigma-70 family RNA polymerase sigma factor n=1 Tax=Helcococcus kunzii TaxID=40091 RepID=UPI0024AE307C|nr:sigma-70 family RNA polymerase sigma factor [Helcococcus kunzii]
MENTLSGNETNELINEYQKIGRPQIMRNLIATSNIPLMKSILKTYNLYSFDNKDNEEIEQEAFILMLEAIDKYDITKGAFSTFLFIYLKNIFRNTQDYNQDVSLESPISNSEDDNLNLIDTIEDETSTDKFEEIEQKSENENIRNRLEKILQDEEKQILYQYYGIGSKNIETPTYKQLAEKYNCSIEWIRNRLERAKRKIENDKQIKYIYYDYCNPVFIKSNSVLQYRPKTNKVFSIVEEMAIERIEQEEKIKAIVYEAINSLDDYNNRKTIK